MALGEHLGIGVKADCVLEQRSETDGEYAGPAAGIQKPAASVETRLLGQDSFELRRVRGTAVTGSG